MRPQFGKAEVSPRPSSQRIPKFISVVWRTSYDDRSYYARSINTMRVDEGDKLVSESNRLYSNVQVRWQGILAVKSEYVRISESETRCHRITSVLSINTSWTKRQTQDAPWEFQIWIFSNKGWHQTKEIGEKSSYDFWKFVYARNTL